MIYENEDFGLQWFLKAVNNFNFKLIVSSSGAMIGVMYGFDIWSHGRQWLSAKEFYWKGVSGIVINSCNSWSI